MIEIYYAIIAVLFVLCIVEVILLYRSYRKVEILKAGVRLSSMVLEFIKRDYSGIDLEFYIKDATRYIKEENRGKRN